MLAGEEGGLGVWVAVTIAFERRVVIREAIHHRPFSEITEAGDDGGTLLEQPTPFAL